jgi:hypothetical protein
MMAKKILLVTVVVIGIVVVSLLMNAFMPAIQSMVNVAYTDPSAANYTGYKDALGAAPLWIYFIPVLIGGLAIFFILRREGR